MPRQDAYAKINLALHVLGQRDDGFHALHSLCVFTALADTVRADPAPVDLLSVAGPFGADLPQGRANLVMRALEKFRGHFPGHLPDGLALRIEKNLPLAAGLGGGSADAAAALRLFARMSAHAIDESALFDLAIALGADVPMCLVSSPCEVSGKGETVRPLTMFPPMHLVLVNLGIPLATPDVFRALTQKDNPPMPALGAGFDRASALSLWLADTRNDLEAPALALLPQIGAPVAALGAAQDCVLARMSGSGATVFGLFGSAAAAHQAARDMRQHFPDAWVAATSIGAA